MPDFQTAPNKWSPVAPGHSRHAEARAWPWRFRAVERGVRSSRAPFLDLDPDNLDPDNSSGALGTGFVTRTTGGPVPIADDGKFANGDARVLRSLTFSVTATVADQLAVDPSLLKEVGEKTYITLSGVGDTNIEVTGNNSSNLTLKNDPAVPESSFTPGDVGLYSRVLATRHLLAPPCPVHSSSRHPNPGDGGPQRGTRTIFHQMGFR